MSGFPVQALELKKLGLTDYQARSLLALMAIGAGTPRDVARESGIPYPSAYDSLRILAEKGWIESASTRPAIFRVREPKLMKEKVTVELANLFENLERQYENVRGESSKLQLIYTIVGANQVRAKLVEMLRSMRSEGLLVIPGSILFSDSEQDPLVTQLSSLAEKRGIRFRILTDHQSIDLGKTIEIRTRRPVLAVDLLVDHSRALIALPDLSACGWIDSPAIASHFGQFLDLLWADSGESKGRKKPNGSMRK